MTYIINLKLNADDRDEILNLLDDKYKISNNEIRRTDVADSLLHNIILTIAQNFGDETALEKLDEIEKSINALGDNPYLGENPRYMVMKRQGYKVLILEKDLVFYKVNEERKTVTVYAVVDQRQDYVNIIRGLR